MKEAALPAPLTGVIPPLVTPLADRDELDIAGLERLVEHTLAGGVHGLFVLGTTGEGPALSYLLRYELIERVCKQVAGRVPVLVGITDTAWMETVRLADHAGESGAQAVVLSTPYYFPIDAAGQADLREYVRGLAAELPLPIFLYSIPSHAKNSFTLETVRAVLDLPQVIGMKDSGGDLNFFRELLQLRSQRPDWSLLIGPEEQLGEAVLLGADGGVCGGGNLDPRLYVAIYEAARRQDQARVRELQQRVETIVRTIYAVGRERGSWLKGLKCALACLGICDDFMAEPFRRLPAVDRARIAAAVADLGLLTGERVATTV